MKRSIIRWPGLAAFGIIIGLLVIISWLFLDSILKISMEYSLGRLNGAEVNIEKVEHRWSPLTLTAHGVEATDPAKPTHNQVQLARLSADVSVAQLLLGRIHIDQLDVVGVRVDQERSSGEGDVYVMPDKDDVKNWASTNWEKLKVSLPEKDEIIAQVGLQTDQVLDQAETKIEQQRQQFEQAKDGLPDKQKIAEYQQRIKELTESDIKGLGDVAARKEKLDQLKQSIREDKQAIKQFREQLSESAEVVKQQIEQVKQAPGNDIDRIRDFFQLNQSGLQNITGLLLGEKAKQWSEYLLLAYEQLAPMLARSSDTETVKKVRGAGESLSFAEEDAPPEFWIKNARTEVIVADSQVDINWQNITHQHNLLGQPTTYQARLDNSKLWQAFNLNGELSLLASGIDAKQQWQLKGANLNSLGLSNSEQLTASIASALLDSDGTVLVRENQLDGDAVIRMLDLTMDATGSSKITDAVATALKQLNRLDINTNFSGSILNPKLGLNSDLDQQLGKLLSQTAMAEAEGKLGEIKADLMSKVEGQLGSKTALLENISSLNSDAQSFDNQLEDLLKAKIEDNLKDKLKGRLFGGL
ncbi:TIGR03545 family protein [Idiomarina seosinensis]|uniref:TIGR03545 family protein n=1 Tax=Idiomarina seosinensis TaxID=281739 RepID=A0A432ZBC8_9GAMM|nr:TIGR03545 family protein [Idiomarina seosinensis]RUO75267.1 TIGR03545 family protein [Idiomarina seosinensis]